jgi:hypothetical protein
MFIYLKSKNIQPLQSRSVNEVALQIQETNQSDADITAEIQRHNQKMTQLRNRLVQESKLDIVSYPLPKDEQGRLSLTVEFSPYTTLCREGDFDFIESYLKKYRDKKIQITIEEMGAYNPVKGVITLNANAIKNAKKVKFRIKPDDEKRLYGLYICSSELKDDTCGGKPASNLSQRAEKIARDDQVFYFQSFYLTQQGIKLPANLKNRDNINYFRKLSKITASDQRKSLRLVKDHTATLGSLPIRAQEDYFQIPMPHRDERCKGI